jgi:transcriptional regulator
VSIFEDVSAADVDRLIREFPLAWIIVRDEAHPVPLVPEHDDPPLRRLIGHIPRVGGLAGGLSETTEAMLLFQGPQGYLSPSCLSNRDWAPTWCSATIRLTAEITLVPEATAAALRRMVTVLERGRARPWDVSEIGARFERLAEQVVAIHCVVKTVRPRFRLAQNESGEVFGELLQALDGGDLAAWMRHMRPA